MNYRRYYVPDFTVFIVGVTKDRIPYFTNPENIALFKEMLRKTKERFPFEIPAIVLMPDHFHIFIDPIDCTFSQIMQSFKKRFTQNYKKRKGVSSHFNF